MNPPPITSIAPTVVDAAESIGETVSDTVTDLAESITDGASAVGRTARERSRISLLVVVLTIAGVIGVVAFLKGRSAEDDRAEAGAPGTTEAAA